MAIRSMTGFGSASSEADGVSIRVEVRSVNHRYLQVKMRLPGELGALESDVEELVRKRAHRGAFTVSVNVQRSGPAAFRVRADTAEAYVHGLRELAVNLGLGGELRLEHLLQMPGVVEPTLDRGRTDGKRVLGTLGEALDELERMRGEEGDALLRELRRHVVALRELVGRIEERMPVVVTAHHANLKKRVEELLDGRAAVAPVDLARELAVLADRLDVSEELSRLASHLDQLDGLFDKDKAVGRQLDFLVQEVLREVNTIGSKCNDATTAHWVVEAKTLVERVREQVQNVE